MMTCAGGSVDKTKHVFISYNHGSKATVLRLRDQLRAAGFTVWVDEEGVCTSVFVISFNFYAPAR